MSDTSVIEIYILFERATGNEKVEYVFSGAPGDQAMDLFITPSGSTAVLYHEDAYYDDVLRQRRITNNMFLPKTRERLHYVGSAWKSVSYDRNDYILLGKATLASKNILIDEK